MLDISYMYNALIFVYSACGFEGTGIYLIESYDCCRYCEEGLVLMLVLGHGTLMKPDIRSLASKSCLKSVTNPGI